MGRTIFDMGRVSKAGKFIPVSRAVRPAYLSYDVLERPVLRREPPTIFLSPRS